MTPSKKTPQHGALGNRNPVVLIARKRKAGPMRDRRKRRLQERTRRELRDQW